MFRVYITMQSYEKRINVGYKCCRMRELWLFCVKALPTTADSTAKSQFYSMNL